MRISQLTGRGWDEHVAAATWRMRQRAAQEALDEEVEFPEAELDEGEQKAAIARERMRRMARNRA